MTFDSINSNNYTMKTKFNGILTLLLAFIVQVSFAQDRTISGTVSDESGPLPGVTVLKKGTTQGTETDFDGKFSIQAKTGDVLVFSFVGMKTTEKTVGASSTYNVVMSSDNLLEEVVVTALGITKKKDEDLSSSTTVKTETLQKSGESGLIQGLAGKTSGLKITRNSGDPGAGAYIQIRGQNTINGSSSPLIILDGVPISNTSVGGGTDGVTQQSRLNDINAEDIENVTVLKGAAAAAVWGTGAANGVIIIKTKSGRAGGKKVSVNIKNTIAIDKINIEFEKQTKFGQGYPAWWYGGTDYSSEAAFWIPNVALSWGDKISTRSGGADDVIVGNERFESISGNVIYPIENKNSREIFNKKNRDAVFGNGYTWDKSISINFSGDDSNTYLSYSDWDQQGIIKGKSSYRRQTVRLNHSANLTEDITIRFNSSYAKIKSNRIQQGSNLSGLYLGYLRTPNDFDNSDYKGTYYNENNIPTANSHRGFRNYLGTSAPIYNNPLWTINEQDNPNKVERFTVSPQLTWNLKENLTLTARYGLDYYNDYRETFFPVNSAGDTAPGIYEQTEITEKTENFNIFLQSTHDISDNFNLSWILGASLDKNQYSSIGGRSTQFTNPDVGDLRIFGNATAENEFPSNYRQETRKSGAYATINADFFNQVLVELTGRYERPSTLEKNIFYPSASLGWKFSENIDSNFLSFGKIRASYGEVGIEPSPYLKSTTFSPGGITSSWGDALDAAAYGNPFTRSVTLGNPNLKEERVKEFEIGTDLRFFNSRATLGFTYYDRKTEDAILFIDVPSTTGFSSTPANAATITNKGFEVDLGVKVIDNQNFKWNVDLNFSKNKNVVEDLSGVKSIFLAGFTGTSSRVVEGEAMGTLWGGRFARNDDGSYVLDSNGFPTLDLEEGILGDPNPDWIGGLGTNLSYKGITLSAQLETSQGNDHWTGTEGVLKYFGVHPETANETTADVDLTTYDGRVIPAGTTFRGNIGNFGGDDVALTEEWYLAEGGGFGNQSETFVQDASWTRLREVSLGYSFPKSVLDQIGLSNLEFIVSGRNLALWTDIEGFDPDLNLTGASKGRGLDYFTNPSTKSFLFTLKLGF